MPHHPHLQNALDTRAGAKPSHGLPDGDLPDACPRRLHELWRSYYTLLGARAPDLAQATLARLDRELYAFAGRGARDLAHDEILGAIHGESGPAAASAYDHAIAAHAQLVHSVREIRANVIDPDILAQLCDFDDQVNRLFSAAEDLADALMGVPHPEEDDEPADFAGVPTRGDWAHEADLGDRDGAYRVDFADETAVAVLNPADRSVESRCTWGEFKANNPDNWHAVLAQWAHTREARAGEFLVVLV